VAKCLEYVSMMLHQQEWVCWEDGAETPCGDCIGFSIQSQQGPLGSL